MLSRSTACPHSPLSLAASREHAGASEGMAPAKSRTDTNGQQIAGQRAGVGGTTASGESPTKKEALQTGLLVDLFRRILGRQRRLATYAANATGVDHVDQVSHMLNAWYVSNGFLHELLQIKRWQLAGQKQCT